MQVRPVIKKQFVTFGDGGKGQVIGCGTLKVPDLPVLKDTLLVEGLKVNLISISQLCDGGYHVKFTHDSCHVLDNNGGVLMKGSRAANNCYLIRPTGTGDEYEDRISLPDLRVSVDKGLQVFTFKQLQSATGGLGKSNVIGHGGFGLVYRGVLNDGRKVAVKLMDQAGKQGEEEFKVEVDLLSRIRSPYLLSLIGYCSDRNHKLLVYEFMANGGLQEHLYPISGSNAVYSKLDWDTRLRIALDAAKGLEYLHEQLSPPVIHRDFKSSNILLDKNFSAKVSDFGLAKLGSEKAGGHVSTRVEFPVDMKRPPGEGVLVSWALPRLTDREKVISIMDPVLEGQYSPKEVVQVAAIAAMCVQPEADYRPLMADVVQSLVPLVKQQKPVSSKSDQMRSPSV
ncbi:unnamed protein product [Rhodiola kirilowii]